MQFSNNVRLSNACLCMYNSPDSTGETLAKVIKDMLLRLHFSLGRLSVLRLTEPQTRGQTRGVQAIMKPCRVSGCVVGIMCLVRTTTCILIHESSNRKRRSSKMFISLMFMPEEAVTQLLLYNTIMRSC